MCIRDSAKAGFEDDFVKFYNEHIGTACDGSGLGLKFADEFGELTLCNGIVKTEDGVISSTIDIRVPVTLKADEVRKMCADRLEDENGRIEVHMIGDALFFPRESPLVNALYKAYVDVTGDTENKPMVIGGGTGSGKTTFLGALSNYIPKDERLITIEDNAELKIQGVQNLVRLEAKMANVDGGTSITIRDLIRTALRMRPDRIVVGEVRGGEAVDMLQALNTGHEGSLSTAHANSAVDMLSRLETMTLMGVELPLEAIRRQIASGVDILIHLGRMRDKSRKVLEITEVCGFEEHEIKTRTLYRWQEGKGLVQTAQLLNREKLVLSLIHI